MPIRPGGGSAYEKVARRVGDWSVAAAGTVLWLDPARGTATDGPGARAGTAADGPGARARTVASRAGSKTGTRTRNGAADGRPVVVEAGIGLAAVGASHFVATEAEDFLRGRPATARRSPRLGASPRSTAPPAADQRGPVDYKRHLTAELTTRALRQAAGTAGGREVEITVTVNGAQLPA